MSNMLHFVNLYGTIEYRLPIPIWSKLLQVLLRSWLVYHNKNEHNSRYFGAESICCVQMCAEQVRGYVVVWQRERGKLYE
jgi:hypothetical protein